MEADKRLWRTGDGGLVLDGDPAGESLAYTPGDVIAPADEARVPRDDEPKAKRAQRPADKAVKAGEDK